MNPHPELLSQMQQQQQAIQQHQLALQQAAPGPLLQRHPVRPPGTGDGSPGSSNTAPNQIPFPLQTSPASSPSPSVGPSTSQPSSPNGTMVSLQPPSPAKANTNTFVHKLHK
ncbi:hypothetical protein BGW42_003126 [Actinomortierella wolfii]|nr:hypothetical protein BGW42_003126 [Actinomortierella wolfii]